MDFTRPLRALAIDPLMPDTLYLGTTIDPVRPGNFCRNPATRRRGLRLAAFELRFVLFLAVLAMTISVKRLRANARARERLV